jgi:hypothetical protein
MYSCRYFGQEESAKMHIPRKMTDVLPAAGTKTSPSFGDNEFGLIKGIDSSIQTTMAPSHPQMRRFSTADAQDIHDNVRAHKKPKS